MISCKACDRRIENITINPHSGTWEDLCYVCRGVVARIDTCLPRSYTFENEREGVKAVPSDPYDGNVDDY